MCKKREENRILTAVQCGENLKLLLSCPAISLPNSLPLVTAPQAQTPRDAGGWAFPTQPRPECQAGRAACDCPGHTTPHQRRELYTSSGIHFQQLGVSCTSVSGPHVSLSSSRPFHCQLLAELLPAADPPQPFQRLWAGLWAAWSPQNREPDLSQEQDNREQAGLFYL